MARIGCRTVARQAGQQNMKALGPRLRGWAQRSLLVALLSWQPLVGAQPVTPPASVDPGRLRERFDLPPEPAAPLRLPELKGAPDGTLPEDVRTLRVTLRSIRIVGATAYTPEQLREQTDAYLGREISGADIYGLAQALTARYRNDGYFLSLVIVPPQLLADGTLTLRVIEGYIASVHLEGDVRLRPRLLALADKIMASRPLQARVLERYLLLANDLPGMQLRSVLAPSQTPGAADLTLIASVKTYEVFASLDNYGSRYLGPNQATLGLTLNQLFGEHDQLRYIGVGSGDTRLAFHQLSLSQVVTAEGLKLGVTVSQARTRPGDILRAYDVHGRMDAVAFSMSYPWLRTRNQSLHGRLVYDSADTDTDILGSRTTEDRIRAIRAGLSWQQLDGLDGQNVLEVDLSQGVGGTSKGDALKSRVGADGLFSKLSFDYARFQPWGARWGLSFGLAGQWTGEQPLLSSEQFALGGRRFGRAYEAAELVGDRGLALRLEPRYAGSSQLPGLRAYHLLGFYDIGEVTRVGVLPADTPATQSLASAGFGMRLFPSASVTAQLEAAWPLTRGVASSPDEGKHVRLLGSVMVRF